MGSFRNHVFAALLCLTTALSVLAFPTSANAAAVPWWNGAYSDRQPIAIRTVDALASGYSIELTISHAGLVSATKSLASGNDVRIVYWNGSTNQEIDRILAVGSSWNSGSTKLFFRTQTAIAASATSFDYYMYFGNGSAGSPPANGDNVYDLYDNFNAGSYDSSKWTKMNNGLSVEQTGGEMVISATNFTPSGWHSRGFYPTTKRFLTNYISEVDFRIVSQSAAAATSFEGQIGSGEGYAAISPNTVEWFDGYNSNPTNSWFRIGDSAYAGTSTPYHRVKTAVTTNTLSYYEDGSFKGSRNQIDQFTDINAVDYFYATHQTNQTFEVRFDNAVVRKYTANPPTAVLTASNEIIMSAVINPVLIFSITGRSTACNGVTPTVGTTSSASAVSFGAMAVGDTVVAQELTVASNAASGHTVYMRSTSAFASGSSTIASLGSNNANPGAFSSGATGAIGYTTDALLGTGTANRFTSGGAKWAGLSTTAGEVGYLAGPTSGTTTCVAFRAGTTSQTPAGSYSTNVIYTVVPIF